MAAIELTDEEFSQVAEDLCLTVDVISSFPGYSAQGFDDGFRSALKFALGGYVNSRIAAAALPSEREVANSFLQIANHAMGAAEEMSPLKAWFNGTVSTADGFARSLILMELKTAAEACLALSRAAVEKARELEQSASRTVKREPVDTIVFIATLREILRSAGIKTAIGMNIEAEIAHARPMFRLTERMLSIALSRLPEEAKEETKRVLALSPVSFIKFIRNAQIT
jgi:hypothetical protein